MDAATTSIGLRLAHGEPAGGAPTQDLIPAAIVGLLLVGALGLFGWAHRSRRMRVLTQLGALSERVSGLPGWAALPLAIAGGALIVAVFGFYWDVATHIDNGRDPGPFANPAHWLIIGGLGGIAVAGYASLLLGSDETPSALRLKSGWHAPLGGALLALCGGIAVLGFPLDDVWHRIFGQDVTLWGPTHMQMVGGAALSTIAVWILLVEAQRHPVDEARAARTIRFSEAAVTGAFLVGLSAFQAEFDYSVPQFRLLYHPILLMLTSGIVLVAARVSFGAGAALRAVAFFLGLRVVLSVIIGPVLGHTTLHFPLYVIEALAIELLARRVPTSRQVTFGALAGAALGTFGLAAEWLWSHVFMTIPWPAVLVPEGIVFGVVAGIAGGVLGGLIGRALLPVGEARQEVPSGVVVATGLTVLFVLLYPFPTNAELDGTATVTLTEVSGRDGRWVDARISLEPRDLATGADWFNVTAWQGGGSIVMEPVETSPGEYEMPARVPVYGEWKALIRLQRGASVMAVPIFLPKDEAIPAPEVPAESRFTRPLISDKEIVLREAKDAPAPVVYGASIVMIAIAALWLAAFAWVLRRMEVTARSVPQVPAPAMR